VAELIPVLAFIVAGAAFWWLGRDTRAGIAGIAAAETTMDGWPLYRPGARRRRVNRLRLRR
jgi:hypothetical protein